MPASVTFDVPALVENGNAVPVTVTRRQPDDGDDHVAVIAIFNEKNPERGVARSRFGPRAGRASVSTRIRLATSQQLAAVARMSDGTHLGRVRSTSSSRSPRASTAIRSTVPWHAR